MKTNSEIASIASSVINPEIIPGKGKGRSQGEENDESTVRLEELLNNLESLDDETLREIEQMLD